MKTETFRITAVRLVEFHNLGTTTVEIPEGGHLFLLGDNGSGKTTLLDAVHLVLTGGREMEFNSAARVAGAKDSGGRTIQGIVLRYNASTGRPMREAGITYAAVELTSDSGRSLSLVVGLSATGLDVAYERWGGLASVPASALPLDVEEDGRLRAATAAEFKRKIAALPGGRAFAHIGDYQTAVGERLFGGADKYEDVCKLLRTGKAYREIAARAANYDELFRKLLEDPSRETFEPLLKGLRELDESKARMDQLDERNRYLDALDRGQTRLGELRHTGLCIEWAEADSKRAKREKEAATLTDAIAAGEASCRTQEEQAARTVSEGEKARARVAALRAKDASGLLEREKAASVRVVEAERRAASAADTLAETKKRAAVAAKRLADERAARRKTLAHEADALSRLAKGAGIVVGSVTDALLGVQGEDPGGEAPDFAVVFSEAGERLTQRRDETMRAAISKRGRADEARTAADVAKSELDALRARGENMPSIDGFAEVRGALRDRMYKARPVYELLEPASGCDACRLALLERLAGEDFLSTWVVDESEADAVRQIVWKQGARLAVAVRGASRGVDPTLVAPWLGQYLSFEDSDVAAVQLLARHLGESTSPSEVDFLSRKAWAFRGREGLVPADPPRLVGAKARAAEQARRERMAEQALDAAEKALRFAEKEADAAEKLSQSVKDLGSALEEARIAASKLAGRVAAACAEAVRTEEACVRDAALAAERREEAAAERSELEDLRVKMRTEGIDGTLEKRIDAAEKEVRRQQAKADELNRAIGENRARIKALTDRREICAREALEAGRRAEALAGQFAAGVPDGVSVGEHARAACPEAFAAGVDFGGLREATLLAARDVENNIKNRIRDIRGEPYGFSFDAAANRLVDRRGTALADVMADESKRLGELRDVINEKSREVFERIFMGEVMQRLSIDLARIEHLVRQVQRLLKGRRFGSNRYDFVLSSVPEYEAFVKLVRKGYRLDSDEEKRDLRDYLDARREEILNTEIDAIPDVFDYRKWFRFALKVSVENDEGIVIDRKVKSMGSGGEQAVPNYLLILTVAEFLYHGGSDEERPRTAPILFDEAFYGIDAARRDQLLGFAEDLGLQLFVSSPDQDGVKREIRHSVSLLVIKDEHLDVHLSPVVWNNGPVQGDLLSPDGPKPGMTVVAEGAEK